MTDQIRPIEGVYEEHGARLWRALLGYAGDPHVASDAMAEAFAQALAHESEIRSPADWVWTASFRIARGMLADPVRAPVPDRDQVVEMPESVRDLVWALDQLPERQRFCVVLHDYGDRPVGEVAQALGISSGTVYVHLSQGRRRLRSLLEDHDA